MTFSIIVRIFRASTYIHPMKKLLVFLAIVFFAGNAGAQTTEFLQQKDFQAEKKKIYEGINASKKQMAEIRKVDAKIAQSVDSLKRKLTNYEGQLGMATDSLSKTGVKLNALQEKVDNEKFLSGGLRILIIVILILLFAILFVLLYLFKKRADQNQQALIDLDKKTNERFDMEVKGLKGEIQGNLQAIQALSSELTQRISTGLISLETRNHQLEKQLREDLSGIEVKIGTFGQEFSKFKEEQSHAVKSMEDRLNAIKKEADLDNQGFATRASKIEEELHLLKKK